MKSLVVDQASRLVDDNESIDSPGPVSKKVPTRFTEVSQGLKSERTLRRVHLMLTELRNSEREQGQGRP